MDAFANPPDCDPLDCDLPDSSAVRPLWSPSDSQTNRYPELADLAARQLGIVRRGQLRSLGWTPGRIDHEIAVGRWSDVAPRVVAMQNGPLGAGQRLWLGTLHAGEGAALTHLTACAQAGLRWEGDGVVHVLTAKGDLVSPLAGFRFHQTRRPFVAWLHPSASPVRIGIEHAALLAAERDRSLRRAVGLVAAVVQQRLSTAERLVAASVEMTKLRHGHDLRLALGDIAGGAHSFAEIDIGRLCADRGLRPPRRQVLRTDASGRRRYLDCEWDLPDGRILVLEIDGSFHMRAENWWRDMQRERSVVLDGRVVLRCASIEIRLEPERIAADLVRMGVPRIAPGIVWERSA